MNSFHYRVLNSRGIWTGWKSVYENELQKKIDFFQECYNVAFQYKLFTINGKLIEGEQDIITIINDSPDKVIAGELKSWQRKTKKLFDSFK